MSSKSYIRPDAFFEALETIVTRITEMLQRNVSADVFIFMFYAVCLFPSQVLTFDANHLRENLKFCEKDSVKLPLKFHFDRFEDAKNHVEGLWPKSGPLEKEPSFLQSFTGNKISN